MIHFSVDDTIDIFKNLSSGDYSSCFFEPTLSFLKELHLKYGLKASLYCFFKEDSGFNLLDATDKYKEEFLKNSNWLKFGFHAYDRKSDYSSFNKDDFLKEAGMVYDNLKRIVSDKALTYDVRLGFAKGNKECIKGFKEKYPLFNTLYGVDDMRIEYYLTKEENDLLIKNQSYYDKDIDIEIKLSELRLEKQTDLDEYLKNIETKENYVFFTHEIHLNNEKVREDLIKLCKFADEFTL